MVHHPTWNQTQARRQQALMTHRKRNPSSSIPKQGSPKSIPSFTALAQAPLPTIVHSNHVQTTDGTRNRTFIVSKEQRGCLLAPMSTTTVRSPYATGTMLDARTQQQALECQPREHCRAELSKITKYGALGQEEELPMRAVCRSKVCRV